MIDHPLPEIVCPVLDEYLAQMDVHLPGLLDGLLVLLSDWGIQWTVLGVLRQFYTFRESAITTKLKAGEYALAHLPLDWRRLIQEALRIRRGGKPSFYRCRLSRALEARKFLLYIIQTCNSEFEA